MEKQIILKIINEEISHLQNIKSILQETNEKEALDLCVELFYERKYPFRRRIIEREVIKEVKVNCPFENQSNTDIIKFLTAPGQRQEGVNIIKDFIYKSKYLIIVDPYFFNPTDKKNYIKEIQKTFIKPSITKLDIYCLPGPTKKIKEALQEICKEKNIQFNVYTSVSIHDRIIISDNEKAIVVGTSFGGLGNKYAFILPLPNEDLKNFKKELFKLKK